MSLSQYLPHDVSGRVLCGTGGASSCGGHAAQLPASLSRGHAVAEWGGLRILHLSAGPLECGAVRLLPGKPVRVGSDRPHVSCSPGRGKLVASGGCMDCTHGVRAQKIRAGRFAGAASRGETEFRRGRSGLLRNSRNFCFVCREAVGREGDRHPARGLAGSGSPHAVEDRRRWPFEERRGAGLQPGPAHSVSGAAFQREPAGTDEAGPGAGVSFNLVRGIAANHPGSICYRATRAGKQPGIDGKSGSSRFDWPSFRAWQRSGPRGQTNLVPGEPGFTDGNGAPGALSVPGELRSGFELPSIDENLRDGAAQLFYRSITASGQLVRRPCSCRPYFHC